MKKSAESQAPKTEQEVRNVTEYEVRNGSQEKTLAAPSDIPAAYITALVKY